MDMSDEQLVKRCLDGQPDAFRHLVRRHETTLLSHVAGIVATREQAEEITQESFVRAYFALSKLRKRESFFSWLVGIARRVASEQARDRRKRRDIAEQAGLRLATRQSQNDLPLQEAIDGLPERYRRVIQMRYFGGHSCGQVADRLELPLGTVTKQLSRAYAMLREKLQAGQETGGAEVKP